MLAVLPLAAQNDDLAKLRQKIEPYVCRTDTAADWLLSRLQMFWKTHATEVFINGEAFSHPGGEAAPVATVKMDGTRGTASDYSLPQLEDVVPYDDDEAGSATCINKKSGRMERAHLSKTGRGIGTLNRRILGIARDAAKVYAATGEERYAKAALGVFDTYMKGIYYRAVPFDLNHGHQQTLVGMTTFEVIHEDAVNETTEIYQLLGDYITADRNIYEDAFRKWADNIVANGVPHNNWNLIQADFLARIAMALQDNTHYADGHGRQYYLDCIVNRSSIRQWSMKRMADRCFSGEGIWYESPGYSTGTVSDFMVMANRLHRDAGIDLFEEIPILRKAARAMAQYLMPNRMIAGFGDTHPNHLTTKGIEAFIEYAGRIGNKELLAEMKDLLQAVSPDAADEEIERFVSPSFYAPNVSWIAMRSGMNKQHDLMISLNASFGNHQHANGISLELYGKGYVLAPDGGIGKNLYGGLDYAEYYSQFPAHNTVCVNGISSYPAMGSHHPFRVVERHDTWTCVEFTEPETGALQQRTCALVKTSDSGGYYIDIFRSRVGEGEEEFHDYFYHNLGQQMTLTDNDGGDLGLQPTEELAFAGGHLNAYSYIYNKEAATTARDVCATFTTTDERDGRQIFMKMWMQGEPDRTVFRALSPVNMEYERIKDMPYKVIGQPVLTYVARQYGEAWNHPFVSILEPSDTGEPSEIESVTYFKPKSKDTSAQGICVKLLDGRTHYIFSSATGAKMSYQGMKAKGRLEIKEL